MLLAIVISLNGKQFLLWPYSSLVEVAGASREIFCRFAFPSISKEKFENPEEISRWNVASLKWVTINPQRRSQSLIVDNHVFENKAITHIKREHEHKSSILIAKEDNELHFSFRLPPKSFV